MSLEMASYSRGQLRIDSKPHFTAQQVFHVAQYTPEAGVLFSRSEASFKNSSADHRLLPWRSSCRGTLSSGRCSSPLAFLLFSLLFLTTRDWHHIKHGLLSGKLSYLPSSRRPCSNPQSGNMSSHKEQACSVFSISYHFHPLSQN